MTDQLPRAAGLSMVMFTVLIFPGAARAAAPIFQSSSYSFDYSLDQQGTYVGLVEAFDPDFDLVHYEMNDPSCKFSVTAFNGCIHANSGVEPGTYEMTIVAEDIFGASSSVDVEVTVTPGPPPEIVSYSVTKYFGNYWIISGIVDSSTPEGDVIFGGLLAGRSAHYYANGQFSLPTTITGTGNVTLFAEDDNGQVSDTETHPIN